MLKNQPNSLKSTGASSEEQLPMLSLSYEPGKPRDTRIAAYQDKPATRFLHPSFPPLREFSGQPR